MPVLHLPVRYYRDFEPHNDYVVEALMLKTDETAFLLVDVDTQPDAAADSNDHAKQFIAPALNAARTAGILVAYVHNDLRAVADYGNIVFEIWRKTKNMEIQKWKRGRAFAPTYPDFLKPKPTESDFPKWAWSGFHNTMLDQHLRGNEIKNLICVGYNLRACFYQTLVDAVYRNYRVIALRDATRASEMPDTKDERLEEGGWIAKVFVRQIEHLIGYTATSSEFAQACNVAKVASGTIPLTTEKSSRRN